jgi:S-adenosylmethionine hydrolase
MPFITLTTDFGEGSLYVAEMKGVILSIQPEARIIDITHSLPPQDIRQGAIALEQATPKFPVNSIHLAVVDPGVGTSRKIVYASIGRRHYIAPDNGLLGLLARRHAPSSIISLTDRSFWRDSVSNTFHGRDIMAPAAAHLAAGVSPSKLGEPLVQLAPLDWPELVCGHDRLVGEICTIDAFGNLITNIDREHLDVLGPPQNLSVTFRGQTIFRMASTYGDRAPGDLVALLGSSDRLEIAIVGGSARNALSAGIGERVVVLGRTNATPIGVSSGK